MSATTENVFMTKQRSDSYRRILDELIRLKAENRPVWISKLKQDLGMSRSLICYYLIGYPNRGGSSGILKDKIEIIGREGSNVKIMLKDDFFDKLQDTEVPNLSLGPSHEDGPGQTSSIGRGSPRSRPDFDD